MRLNLEQLGNLLSQHRTFSCHRYINRYIKFIIGIEDKTYDAGIRMGIFVCISLIAVESGSISNHFYFTSISITVYELIRPSCKIVATVLYSGVRCV